MEHTCLSTQATVKRQGPKGVEAAKQGSPRQNWVTRATRPGDSPGRLGFAWAKIYLPSVGLCSLDSPGQNWVAWVTVFRPGKNMHALWKNASVPGLPGRNTVARATRFRPGGSDISRGKNSALLRFFSLFFSHPKV